MAGVTVSEFADLCAKHRYDAAPVPRQAAYPFLERCLELGFVTKQHDSDGASRYTPTDELRRIVLTLTPAAD